MPTRAYILLRGGQAIYERDWRRKRDIRASFGTGWASPIKRHYWRIEMTRYQALRKFCGCGPFTAAFIAFGNFIRGVPPGLIVFMTVQIEYDN